MIFEHVGITVSDLDKSIDFYTKVFGFKVLRKTTINAYLFLDDQLMELEQSTSPENVKKPETPEEWEKYRSGPVGIRHIGFRVDDMEEAIERITLAGGELVVSPFAFEPEIEHVIEPNSEKLKRAARPVGKNYWKVAMFSDPDGILLELLER